MSGHEQSTQTGYSEGRKRRKPQDRQMERNNV